MKEDGGVVGSRPTNLERLSSYQERQPLSHTLARPHTARVVIRPARPDDLEEAALLERCIWGRLAAPPEELQRRLFAFPDSFLLAELHRAGRSRRIVALTNGLLWTRETPRSYLQFEQSPLSTSHNPRGDLLYLASIGVEEQLRGRNIGLRLLQEIREVGRRRHLKVVRAVANHRSRSLFLRAGFEAIRPLPRLYRQHRDLMPRPVLMDARLA
jgi:ribosomal protein S18 acetylase RimI-like enzyme